MFKKCLCSNKSVELSEYRLFMCSTISLIKMGDKTAVIYARVSSTGERQSTERQVKDLSDYALYRQMDVRKVFEEHISGAKKNEERPVLCEAIAYCKEQKEQFNLLDDDGKPSLFAPVMLATLSTCAQLERDNITFRLQSGRKQYIAKGGKLGRKPGSMKSVDQKKEEYREAISLLKKGYAIRDVAKLMGKGISTIQRLKKEFC